MKQVKFTEDQLSWMREMQRSGWNFATRDKDCLVCVWPEMPTKGRFEWNNGGEFDFIPSTFLDDVVMWKDEEPFCFAVYAPIFD